MKSEQRRISVSPAQFKVRETNISTGPHDGGRSSQLKNYRLFLLILLTALLWSSSPPSAHAAETIAQDWNVADIGIGTKPAFDFGENDQIHIMGMTETTVNGAVWYASATNLAGPWNIENVSAGYFYGPGDIIVDPTGTVHISWHNHNLQSPNHLMIDSGGNRTHINIPTPMWHDGWDSAFALDSNGRLYMSANNPSTFGAPNGLEYGEFDGTTWSFIDEVPGSGSFMYGLATSIGIDSQFGPHIAYCRAIDFTMPGDLYYATNPGGTGWLHTNVTNANGLRGRFPSLVLDDSDEPRIAWLDIDELDNTRATVRYGFRFITLWQDEFVDLLDNIELSFNGARKSVSLALDSQGVPHIAYASKRVVKYAKKPGAAWQITTVLESDTDLYKGLAVLKLDSNDNPTIVFWQDLASEPGLVRLIQFNPPQTGVDSWEMY